jgi:hypothetical protein
MIIGGKCRRIWGLCGAIVFSFGLGAATDCRDGCVVRLRTFATATGPIGLIVQARINDGPPLRFLLDSGAENVVLDRATARKSGCVGGADLPLIVPGERGPAQAKILRAGTLKVGELSLSEVPLLAVDSKLSAGIDGVLPLSVFAGYLIHLDIPGRTLELTPYPAGSSIQHGPDVISSHGLLFVKAVLNEGTESYYLLDTGAAYNAISEKANRKMYRATLASESVSLKTGVSAFDAPIFRDGATLRVGSEVLAADPMVAVDLSTASRYHTFEVSGLIGYPALRHSILTVNYRDKQVQIDPR